MYAIQFKPLQPPLLFPWLVAPALRMNSDEATIDRAARFLGSVPILLEAPVIAMKANHDCESWNHALLTENLPTVLGVLNWGTGEVSDEPVLLTHVLFELPPPRMRGLDGSAPRRRANGCAKSRAHRFRGLI